MGADNSHDGMLGMVRHMGSQRAEWSEQEPIELTLAPSDDYGSVSDGNHDIELSHDTDFVADEVYAATHTPSAHASGMVEQTFLELAPESAEVDIPVEKVCVSE